MFLQSFRRYKDIILYRTIAGIKSEGRQRHLGYIWFLLEPMLSTAVLYIAFSQITGQKGADAILFILIGMILWQWFEGSVQIGVGAIKSKFHVLNQFNLPKFIFPIVSILVNTWKFLCVSIVILGLTICFGYPPNIYWTYLPLLFILQLFLIISITLSASIAVTLINDFRTILNSIFRLFFFLSGIFFSSEKIPEHLLNWFFLNPMATFIESGRNILLKNEAPPINLLIQATLVSLLFFALGIGLNLYYDKKILKLTNV